MAKFIAHFGIRTRRLEEMIRWYEAALEARVQYRNSTAAFLTFDDEHHRLAMWTDEETIDRLPTAACVDHICLGVSSFEELADVYERLKKCGITPALPVNHRFTTSLYYRDPDGNEVEFSVDNFSTKEEGNTYVQNADAMEALLVPPFGDLFDPEELVRMVRSGATSQALASIGRGING